MILTDKAKEDFKEWVFENYYFQDLNVLYPLHLIDTLIIEFFDSVGVYIGVYSATNYSQYLMFEISINDYWIGEEENRQQATEQAIKKANDIYNERFK